MESSPTLRQFAIVFVLGELLFIVSQNLADKSPGAPGAGKGTLCNHLAKAHNLTHYSIGDGLRSWMREHRGEPLALQIQDKLDNQGFLSSEDLNPFIREEIEVAIHQDGPRSQGMLIDGFPRCTEQLESFDNWPFQEELPLASNGRGEVKLHAKPDVVLAFKVAKSNARERYLGRGRDSNDSREKFERRFAEYEEETLAVEEVYRHRGVLVEVSTQETYMSKPTN